MNNPTHSPNLKSNALVSIIGGHPVTTTLIIAEGVGRPHHGVIQLIRQHRRDFEEFGPLAFEMRMGEPLPQGGFGKATEYAILNEHQGMLAMTFMRNTDVVRTFKKALIRAFFALAEKVQQLTSEPASVRPDPSWEQCGECEEATRKAMWTLQHQLLVKSPLWNDIRKYHHMGLNNKEIGQLVGLGRAALRRQMRAMEECGLLCPRDQRELERMSVHIRHKYALPVPYGLTARRGRQLELFPVGALQRGK